MVQATVAMCRGDGDILIWPHRQAMHVWRSKDQSLVSGLCNWGVVCGFPRWRKLAVLWT